MPYFNRMKTLPVFPTTKPDTMPDRLWEIACRQRNGEHGLTISRDLGVSPQYVSMLLKQAWLMLGGTDHDLDAVKASIPNDPLPTTRRSVILLEVDIVSTDEEDERQFIEVLMRRCLDPRNCRSVTIGVKHIATRQADGR